MVSSIPHLLLFLFTVLTHTCSLEDDLSNEQPNGFFLPFESNLYVEITIGTPTRNFNLKLDSSTHLTFLECDPCDTDEHQCSLSDTTRRYDGKSSTTFSPISCTNSSLCPLLSPNATNHDNTTTTTTTTRRTTSLSLLCTPSSFCRYDVSSFSAGYLVSDTLQLTSSVTDQENSLSIVRGFVFGCGTSNRVTPEDDGGGVDGRVSLTTHHLSLLSQLRVTRFSHCLWPSSAGSRNYIRIGSAAEFGGDMMLVPMLDTTETNSYSYLIPLLGISLEEQRMRSNETASTIAVDIGTYYTRLETSLYEKVKEELMTQIGPTVAYEVNELTCFTTEVGLEIESLPILTLHFPGFNYTISNKGLYLRDSPSSFCTALVRSTMEDEEKNVLGASGLVDYVVAYDTSDRVLAFQQRDCLAAFVDGI